MKYLTILIAILSLSFLAQADTINENVFMDSGQADFTLLDATGFNPDGGLYQVYYNVPGTWQGEEVSFDAYYAVVPGTPNPDDELYVWSPEVSMAGYNPVTWLNGGFEFIQGDYPLGNGNLFITVDPPSVPEPASLSLLAIGLVFCIQRRKRCVKL